MTEIRVDLATARPSFMKELTGAFERVLSDDARAAELIARFCAGEGAFLVSIDSVRWIDNAPPAEEETGPEPAEPAPGVGGYL